MSEVDDFKLPTDQYYIRNEQHYADRNLVEDKSGSPKAVFCPNDRGDAELWAVERLDNGRYKLSARGGPAGVINHLLFAFILGRPGAEEWIITRRKNAGSRSLYTIEKADRSAGWVKQEGENPQIAVRPLIVHPSLPPQFPPNELWTIQPLVD